MAKYKIAIIEDDQWFSETIKYFLELNEDNIVKVFEDAETYFTSTFTPDVVCVDYQLPGMYGDEVVRNIQKKTPQLPIIVVSAQENMQTTVNLLQSGVKEYIIKGEHAKDFIWKAIEDIKENASLKKQIISLEKKLAQKSHDKIPDIIGNDPSVVAIKKLIHKAAQSNINVSITGETGTGKEVVAQQIHLLSNRREQAFVPVNMGAIPADLVESELFGYEKGAFTGAIRKTKGKFELANGGTLFLDEIAELDPNLQTKILRALQEKEITPLGSEKAKKLDIRLIVATHKNLAEEMQKGNFREDLFYRIIGMPINLSPLRDRGEDTLLLTHYFIEEYTQSNSVEKVSISKQAKEKLMKHSYPGNIRELKSVVDLAIVLCENNTIEAEDIRFNGVNRNSELFDPNLTLKEMTEKIILLTLDKNQNNVMKTAQQLDIGKSTIYNVINRKNESSHL